MACYRPIQAYQGLDGAVFFVERKGRDSYRSLLLPCGQCVGCRLERSRQWAMRCVHEASLHRRNSFITLTYDDVHCPSDGSLRYEDFQKFMKRLRKAAAVPVRFYMCGEYGETWRRPHFHSCLFGFDFPDKKPIRLLSANRLFRSRMLESLWPYGFTTIGEVTFQSAAYVARYCMAKVTGQPAELHYSVVNVETGEISKRVPEFNHMSLKPGIGANWYAKFKSDCFPEGLTVVNGVKVRTPKYYDRKYAKDDPDGFAWLALERELYSKERFADSSPERLAVREVVTSARLRSLSRNL